jgi:hypothetical protein
MARRYELKHEPDGTWSVIDRFTGQPVMLPRPRPGAKDIPLTGFDMDHADNLVDLLNRLDREHRGER